MTAQQFQAQIDNQQGKTSAGENVFFFSAMAFCAVCIGSFVAMMF